MQVSIRSCLVLMLLSVLLPALAAAAWFIAGAYGPAHPAHGMPAAVLAAGVLLAVAVGGVLWAARRIDAAVHTLLRAATRQQAGLPAQHTATGIVEFDAVAAALAAAGESIHRARADLEGHVADAIRHTRVSEQRASQNQRIEALGRLTGGVAHDVNNVLGVISNSAYLIQRQATGADVQVAVAATLRAVEVGSRLTQHLLRFAGRRPVRPERVALERFLVESQELVAMVLGPRITALVSVAPGTGPVRVDGGELELALINLALNARDAMPAGGRVWLKARNAQAQDVPGLGVSSKCGSATLLDPHGGRPASAGLGAPVSYVLITFTDEGVGIAPQHIDRVFDPFFTTKAVGQGTGLGLSQVHGFCVQAGGTAYLTSTPGLGTTAVMVLPAATGEPGTARVAAEPAGTGSIAGTRVLLVEDNEELGAVTAALLYSYGCEVHHVRNPEEALSRLQVQDDFDVVLSDVVMPGDMDGVRFARQLHGLRPTLPVVLISGYSAALADAGDFVVLHKPCTREDMLAALHRAVHPVAPPEAG